MQDGGLRIYSSSLTVGYVIPIRRGAFAPAKLKIRWASHTNPHRGTASEGEGRAKPRTTCNARGFCPHFWGAQICTPLFLNFGPVGIALKRSGPACPTWLSRALCCSRVPIRTGVQVSLTSNVTPTPLKLKEELCQGGPRPTP